MAFDSLRRRTVLFGGPVGAVNETWEWDGVNWARANTSRVPPSRYGHAMAYDSLRQRVVLFGGTKGLAGSYGDTWEYDGTNWTQIKPKTSPGATWEHAMAYDASRRRVVLFGGIWQGTDTWEWDGTNWVRFQRTNAPWARSGHTMVYDAARQRVLLFGGYTGLHYLNDTREWDGKAWVLLKPAASPSVRADHAMAYDSARQRVVLFSGGTVRWSPPQDTWEWGAKLTLVANTSTISYSTGGSQRLALKAGVGLRSKPYWVFGSITGSVPGVVLTGIHIPLNPDHYTSLLVQTGNSREFTGFKGILSATGTASASLNVPKGLPAIPTTLHHAFVVYDGNTSQIFTASNPVSVRLR